jgi:hypothetical protein
VTLQLQIISPFYVIKKTLFSVTTAVKKHLNTGRPINGMFIAFPDSIKNNVEDVSPGFWRVQATKISF